MRICIIGPVVTNSYFGGVAVFNEELAKGFQGCGHDVTILTDQSDLIEREGIVVRRISWINASRLLHDIQPAIVITSLDSAKYLKIVKIDAKKVYFLHGFFNIYHYGMLKSFFAPLYQKWLINTCHYVFSNSYFTRMINEQFFKVKTDAVVHLGVSQKFYGKLVSSEKTQKEKGSIFFAGRLVRAKGVENLVAAIKKLKIGGIECRLIVAGDGPLKRELEAKAKKEKLPIEFIGRINQEEIFDYYQRSEIFVSLNSSEPFGIVFCEALLSNCKIVCPFTGGQVEFLNTYQDRVAFADGQSVDSIAWSIEKLLSIDICDNIPKTEMEKYRFQYVAQKMLGYIALY